jgi:hypothetical protein
MHPPRWSRLAVILMCGLVVAACGPEKVTLSSPSSTVDVATTLAPPSTMSEVPTTVAATTSTTGAVTTLPSTTATTTPPTTTPPTTTPPTTVHAATTTQPAPPTPTDGVAVAYAGGLDEFASYIIAVWTGTAWANPSWNVDGTPIDVGSVARLSTTALGLVEPILGTTYGALDYFCYQDDRAPRLILPPGASTGDALGVSVTADWNIQPRPAASASDPAAFGEAGAAMVDATESAFAAEGVVTQAVDVDLEGDGFADAVYTFERHSDDINGFGTEGDFSLVVAMYPSADSVVRHHVLFQLYEHPGTQPGDIDAEVSAVADLNGDGIMEVVVSWSYWESSVVEVYAFDTSGELVGVAGGGCGS